MVRLAVEYVVRSSNPCWLRFLRRDKLAHVAPFVLEEGAHPALVKDMYRRKIGRAVTGTACVIFTQWRHSNPLPGVTARMKRQRQSVWWFTECESRRLRGRRWRPCGETQRRSTCGQDFFQSAWPSSRRYTRAESTRPQAR